MPLIRNLHFCSDQVDIKPKSPKHELIILTKFHEIRVKTADFLVIAKFWLSSKFSAYTPLLWSYTIWKNLLISEFLYNSNILADVFDRAKVIFSIFISLANLQKTSKTSHTKSYMIDTDILSIKIAFPFWMNSVWTQ